MNLYLSSNLKNKEKVIQVANKLKDHYITLKWWEQDLPQDKTTARLMLENIKLSQTLIFIPPGGRGAHGELTCALTLNIKTIYLLEENQKEVPTDCLFYTLCEKITLNKLPSYLNNIEYPL